MAHSPSDIWAGEVGKVEEFGDGAVVGEGIVTEVNHETKEVTVSSPETPKIADPIEEAAMKFTTLLPFVTKFGRTMSAKGLTRVLFAVAEFPLGASKPKLLDENERQLFYVIQDLMGFKSQVINDIMKKNYEIEQLKQKASLTPETEVKDERSKEV